MQGWLKMDNVPTIGNILWNHVSLIVLWVGYLFVADVSWWRKTEPLVLSGYLHRVKWIEQWPHHSYGLECFTKYFTTKIAKAPTNQKWIESQSEWTPAVKSWYLCRMHCWGISPALGKCADSKSHVVKEYRPYTGGWRCMTAIEGCESWKAG